MAALSPSSRQLARLMIEQLPEVARHIIELGGGTGVFTQALLEHGIEPSELLVVELNEELHQLLRQRFPSVGVVCGDAQELKSIVRDRPICGKRRRRGRERSWHAVDVAYDAARDTGRSVRRPA